MTVGGYIDEIETCGSFRASQRWKMAQYRRGANEVRVR